MSTQPTAVPSSWLVQHRLTEAARFLAEQDLRDPEDIQLALESEQPDVVDIGGRYIADIQTGEDNAVALKVRIIILQKRLERVESRIAKSRSVLLNMLEFMGLSNLVTPWGTASRRRQMGRTLITDEHLIPAEYKRIIPERSEPDKKLIGATLRAGGSVPGAMLGNAYNTLTINV